MPNSVSWNNARSLPTSQLLDETSHNFIDWFSLLLEIFLKGGGDIEISIVSEETTVISAVLCFLGDYWWNLWPHHPEEIAAWKRCKLNPVTCCCATLAQEIVP